MFRSLVRGTVVAALLLFGHTSGARGQDDGSWSFDSSSYDTSGDGIDSGDMASGWGDTPALDFGSSDSWSSGTSDPWSSATSDSSGSATSTPSYDPGQWTLDGTTTTDPNLTSGSSVSWSDLATGDPTLGASPSLSTLAQSDLVNPDDPSVTALLSQPTDATSTVPGTVSTTFDPQQDGLSFVNNGDYGGPGGNCLGMSLIAIDNWQRRQSGTDTPAVPIENQEETVSLAQAESTAIDYMGGRTDSLPAPTPVSDPSQINAALARMAQTGQPEVLTMQTSDEGHANVLYGYQNGNLELYDPNYPGQTVEWPFDPVTGLGQHPMATNPDGTTNDFYGNLVAAGSSPLSGFNASDDLSQIRAACANGDSLCTSRYPTVQANVSSSEDGSLYVSGSVTGGPATTMDGSPSPRVTGAIVTVDGTNLGFVNTNPDGTFRLPVDPSVFSGGTHSLVVQGVAQDDQNNQFFAGFTTQSVSPK